MSASIRDVFETTTPLTIGLEEEVVLLEASTLDLVPVARHVVPEDSPRIKLELPAAQVELFSPPRTTVGEAIADLAAARVELAGLAGPDARPAALAVHPFAPPEGELNPGERYARLEAEYGPIARRQLVCALQVHVAVGDADSTLAVYNELRSFLPQIAAIAAAAPFLAGQVTGLASVRPSIATLLPRQGMPPAIASWEAFEEDLRWGAISDAVPEPGMWWWELRPHVAYGTLELRVPDVQPDLRDGAAVAAFAHALVAWLATRAAAGDLTEPPAPTWRIEENRWSAQRHGVEGTMVDLRTGTRRPTREVLYELLETIEPQARSLGCDGELRRAHDLVETNTALQMLATGGPHQAAEWAADRFLPYADQTNDLPNG